MNLPHITQSGGLGSGKLILTRVSAHLVDLIGQTRIWTDSLKLVNFIHLKIAIIVRVSTHRRYFLPGVEEAFVLSSIGLSRTVVRIYPNSPLK